MSVDAVVPRAVVPSASGVSLIELVVVISLLSVLTVTAVPVFDASDRLHVWGAVRTLERDVQYAREWAVNHGTTTSVVFSLAPSSSYALTAGSPGSTLEQPLTGETFDVEIETEHAASISNLSLSSGSTLQFASSGRALVHGSITLMSGLQTATLHVEEDTGATRIE